MNTRFESWQDHYATTILAADPALLLEAIEEQADRAYDHVVQTPCTLIPVRSQAPGHVGKPRRHPFGY